MVHWKIGKALAKIDGFIFCSEATHYSEDGSAYVGKFTGKMRSHTYHGKQAKLGGFAQLIECKLCIFMIGF